MRPLSTGYSAFAILVSPWVHWTMKIRESAWRDISFNGSASISLDAIGAKTALSLAMRQPSNRTRSIPLISRSTKLSSTIASAWCLRPVKISTGDAWLSGERWH
jgi:hypothetical protein